ncbi:MULTISPECIES: DmsC/YnfH family molybdoenzyme membrane anchor subunit [unclassified Mesorhizobium]|uniref:dimethyl sulfoxide reductase anchor subunit family protein n=1 Tax=unclassified Mesorhizobium TaxID=325217 RepID=UPI001127466C|nr:MULTISPECIES: DmsC/YnfH family molybdoenzyme membrane anchor subunit [unclassified Mesorhizobium]MCA0023387.1 dimethyl sulfoxide reductase anchor subunit [Mesorhizobium sp. B263B1A]TPJ63532.1 dimethyl sulfoxide reductase anchor subunit [Mesorhizobium sp. B2-6-1]TPK00030.1 dimethyl sulfoxide reductase anchor subunit [Mesorhizobium sp. B2-5-12]TPK28007.1 dimethyl sulfoxide reductase anchor subunit [Mesorhizobium sp. B2-5-6]TPK63393.1 dimethyl sulfoxide reductase anchor subunit [Mesorhizobium 
MHPAFSVVFFTTAAGAGYGLLALLGVLAPLGVIAPDFWLGFIGMGLALGLITAGLLSSTGHLGRPERAWRAFSQWRSSWLSREGVASVATFVPAGLFGIGWVILGRTDGWVAAAGLLATIGAVITVCMTGMIYASLKPIAQWHSPYTLPGYLIFSAMSGSVLLAALCQGFAVGSKMLLAACVLLTLLGWAWKLATWRYNDQLEIPTNANTATGLAGGTVRSLEWPHTEENYLLKEMGFRIARKHSAKLRRITQLLGFALPALLLITAFALPSPFAALASVFAAVAQFVGMLVERWLFFAEAKHTVTLYYGK